MSFRYILFVCVLVGFFSACGPAATSQPQQVTPAPLPLAPMPTATPVPAPPELPTIQSPTCLPPTMVTDLDRKQFEMVWTELTRGARGDYLTDIEGYHYELSLNGVLLVWKGSKEAPEFNVMTDGKGTLFEIPLPSYEGNLNGPLFFYICKQGGAYIDDSRAVPAPSGQQG